MQTNFDIRPFYERWQSMKIKQLYVERDELRRRIDLMQDSDSVRDTFIDVYNEIIKYIDVRLQTAREEQKEKT